MNDAHAPQVAVERLRQELAQGRLRFRNRQAVQIELRLDSVLSAAQLLQDGAAHARAGVGIHLSARELRVVRHALEALVEDRQAIGAGEARPWRGFHLRHGVSIVSERAHIAGGRAKQRRFVLLDLLVLVRSLAHFSLPRGAPTRYIGAPLGTAHGPYHPVKILVSNDDGYRAEGILRLQEALAPLADITIVAPDRNRSGASNSLTLEVPLRVFQSEPNVYYVVGTPTDCVHLAISGLFDFEHDMVVSGINDGPNLGDDVLYSGTVAAAIEGRFLGLPTLALSLCTEPASGRHFSSGARVARLIVERLLARPLERALILNVNVPDVPYERLRGFRATRLGFRHRSEQVIRTHDPRGRPLYWVGPAGPEQDAGPGTDFHAIAQGYVSVTPLQIDLTRHAALPLLTTWLDGIDG